TENRGYRPYADRHGLLHVTAAAAHKLDSFTQRQRTGSNQRRILAETMPGDKIRTDSFFFEYAEKGDRSCKNRGLSVLGKLEILLRPFEAKSGYRKIEGGIGFVKDGASGREFLRDLATHARVLRALTRKNKCSFHTQASGLNPTKLPPLFL